MIQSFYKIWSGFLNIGVSPERPEENELVKMFNVMCLLCGMGGLALCCIVVKIGFDKLYLYFVMAISFMYLFAIVAHYFNRIYLARYILSIGSFVWFTAIHVLIGGFFCQGAAVLASIAITYVAFLKKPNQRLVLISLNVISFLLASIYASINGPILVPIDFPNDELIVFIGSLGWVTVVFQVFERNRSQLLENLKENIAELKNTTEELEQFTYVASHDLKSPLRTIHSFIDLIQRDISNDNYSKIEEKFTYVKAGAEQMDLMVEDMLKISKLNKFKDSQRILIDLNVVYNKVIGNLAEEIKEKGAVVSCSELPMYICNEVELIVLFQNFIQNGIKYNESTIPTVKISSEIKDEHLLLYFQDNGIGIEEKYQDQIFQYFNRLHSNDKYKGTGLGLGVCKKIAGNYKGQINVDSSLGQGAKFEISFLIK